MYNFFGVGRWTRKMGICRVWSIDRKNIDRFLYIYLYLHLGMDTKKIEKISKALCDPNRIAILQKFRKKKDCLYCSEVHDMLDLAQPSISHHLKQLVDADLLIPEKDGRNLKYLLNEAVLNDYIAFLNALKG
jgi:Predicted transcriptional regulators